MLDQAQNEKNYFQKFGQYYLFILFEIIIIILYGLFTTFGKLSGPTFAAFNDDLASHEIKKLYAMFQDVHLMIFLGFGFLLSFLKKYSWSSVGINFVLAAWIFHIAILIIGFWKAVLLGKWDSKIELDLRKLIDADFAVAAIHISFFAVLGKLNFIQYLVMGTIEIIVYGFSMNLAFEVFFAIDIGGSMTIHIFGAFFGLAVAMMIQRKDDDNHPLNGSNYRSNLFAMMATVFLWLYWPSFNAAFASGNAQHRAIFNTLLSLVGSCVMVFIITPFFRDGKLHMKNVLNATLAGGVIIGATADILVNPWAPLLIGCGAGIISLVGFEKIGPFLNRTIGLHDSCGIFSLHGMPGLIGGFLSVIVAGTATFDQYGDNLFVLFPKLENNVRTNSIQAGYQLATIATTLGLGLISGLFTGWLLNSSCFTKLVTIFDDVAIWEMNDEETNLEKSKKDDDYYIIVKTETERNLTNNKINNINNVNTENFEQLKTEN